MSHDPKPRVGLIFEELEQVGGLRVASARHARLMVEDLEIVPIAIGDSANERDWPGVVEDLDYAGQRGFRIRAADLRSDSITGSSHLRHYAVTRALARLAVREHLDALHVFGAYGARPFIGAYAAVQTGLPLILSFRGIDLDTWVFGPNLAQLQAAAGVARVCVCMNGGSKRVLEGLLRPTAPVFVSHNFIDPADFASGPVSLPPLAPSVIGCVGEFRRVVGVDFLLRAFETLTETRDLSLLLVGPFRPVEAHYYTALIDSLRSAPRIVRAGRVEHTRVLGYMNACDILAFPSFSDGSPNKLLEAMAAGRAIVAADVGGIPEMIRDGVDGLLIDPTDPNAFVRALESLLDDPTLRQRLGASARERVLREFNAERARHDALEYYRAAGLSIR
ncbi:MAG: glycosyltransferase [Acidobacteriota bacterium]